MAKKKRSNSPKRSQISGRKHGRRASRKSKASKIRKMRLASKGRSRKRKRR